MLYFPESKFLDRLSLLVFMLFSGSKLYYYLLIWFIWGGLIIWLDSEMNWFFYLWVLFILLTGVLAPVLYYYLSKREVYKLETKKKL